MKLSDAIRLGAMLKPQGFGILRDVNVFACAFDAAFLAVVGCGASAEEKYRYRNTYWPFLSNDCTCPVCSYTGDTLAHIISAHLNDKHRWTRQQIADFVQSIEEQQALSPTAAQPEQVAAVEAGGARELAEVRA